jgi:hypothetical protein
MTFARRFARPFGLLIVCAALFTVSAPPAAARTVGQALTIQVGVFGQLVRIELVDWATAEADGGVTLFASNSPGGPLVAHVALLPPFPMDLEAGILPRFEFNGVPPGAYYVVLVSGVVNAPSVPLSAWRPLTVSGGCTGVPGVGIVSRDSAGQTPGTLRLVMGSGDGCASRFDLDAGLRPGGTQVAQLTNIPAFLVVPTPPPGTYYVRVRARNAFGVGAVSDVLPITEPACNTALGQDPPHGPANFKATVAGNNVALSWTITPGGPPTTFQELVLEHLRVGPQPGPTLLLSATATSLSASVPSGTYYLLLRAGNGSGKSDFEAIQFTVP